MLCVCVTQSSRNRTQLCLPKTTMPCNIIGFWLQNQQKSWMDWQQHQEGLQDQGHGWAVLYLRHLSSRQSKKLSFFIRSRIETSLQVYGVNNAEHAVKLRKDDGVSRPLKSSFHQSMVGNLLSAATATRPDLAWAASAAISANTSAAHLTAVKRILWRNWA